MSPFLWPHERINDWGLKAHSAQKGYFVPYALAFKQEILH